MRSKGPTLLDFVAQALVEESAVAGSLFGKAFSASVEDLQRETQELRAKALEANKVDVDEAERVCREVCAASSKASKALAPISAHPDVARLAQRVQEVCYDAAEVTQLVKRSREELNSAQLWSAVKTQVKGSDWFSAWALFFEQLSGAFSRTKPPTPPQPARPALNEIQAPPQQPMGISNLAQKHGSKIPSSQNASKPQENMNLLPSPQSRPHHLQQPASSPASSPPAAKKSATQRVVQLDDDVRIEDLGSVLGMLKKGGGATALPVAASPLPEKKNATLFGTGAPVHLNGPALNPQVGSDKPSLFSSYGKENQTRP